MMHPTCLSPSSLKITFEMIEAYGQLTRDENPIHYDREFARQTEMKGIIAQGTLGLNVLWRSLSATFGEEHVSHGRLDVKFVRPVRENDVLTAGGSMESVCARRYTLNVVNQQGESVIEGTFVPAEPLDVETKRLEVQLMENR